MTDADVVLDSDDEDEIEEPTYRMPSQAERNRLILEKFMELDAPTVTPKMCDFLKQDAVLKLFAQYVVRLPDVSCFSDEGPAERGAIPSKDHVSRDEVETEQLKLSYRVTMLMAGDQPSQQWLDLMKQKADVLAIYLFHVFQPNSAGNLHHACHILDLLLRHNNDAVQRVIGTSSSMVDRFFSNVLQHLDHPSVAELFLTLICKPHNAASVCYYGSSPSSKWKFFGSLSKWKLLVKLADRVCSSEFSQEQTIAASEVLLELLDRLAADENGEILLQPAAYCPDLLNDLLNTALARNGPFTDTQKTAAMRCMLGFLQKSAKDRVAGPPTSPYESFGTMSVNLVPNQLASLRKGVFSIVEKRITELIDLLIEHYEIQQQTHLTAAVVDGTDTDAALPPDAVRHTSYVVKVPFTEFRLDLIQALVELVSQNSNQLEHFTTQLWRVLVKWFFEYSHNNLYHSAFNQLVFKALRSENEAVIKMLMQKMKLVSVLIDHYRDDGNRTSNKGHILRCCNIIRLQVDTLPPDAYLRTFLKSHVKWRDFVDELRQRTIADRVKGLGFQVPKPPVRYGDNTWAADVDDEGIDHGSEFAKSLGFVDDVAWPMEEITEPPRSGSKKKKRKKKAKKSIEEVEEEVTSED